MTPLTPATPADLPAVAALVNDAYRGESAKAGWASEADYIIGDRTTVARLEPDLADPHIHLLLLWSDEADRPLLGCVRLEAAEGDAWALGMLTVRAHLQARGSGRMILQAAEAYARDRGAHRMRLGVISIRDTLIAWYERRGYADTGEREPYGYGGEKMPLEFIVMEKGL